LVVFTNDQPTISLTLDALGAAETTIRATGALFSPTEGTPDVPVVPIRSFTGPDPRNETFSSWLLIYSDQGIRDCADGISTGENFEASGLGCDLAIIVIPGAPVTQALRDAVVQSYNFVEGKETHYIIGAFALLTLVSKRIPILKALRVILERGRLGFKGLFLERFLAREAARVTREAAETGAARLSDLAEIAGRPLDDPARIALGDLAESIVNSETATALQSLGRKYGDNGLERVVTVLGRISKLPGVDAPLITRLIRILDKLPFPQLSDDAFEGMAIFLKRVLGPKSRQGLTRLPNILAHVRTSGTTVPHDKVLNDLFTWIKQGEQAFAGTNLDNAWELFLRKGPGTGLSGSTTGFYHVMDYMANVVGFKAIRGLEVRVTAAGKRFFDLQVQKVIQTTAGPADRLVFIELKNLKAGATFDFGGQVTKDIDEALRSSGYLAGTGTVSDLIERLEGIEYVLRGSRPQMGQVIQGIESTIQKILAPHGLQHLYSKVRIDPLARGLPF